MNKKLSNSSGIAPLKHNGQLLINDIDKANILNSYFESVFTHDNGSLPTFPHRLQNNDHISDIKISPQIVFNILKKLKSNAAAGPDKLPPIFYHHTASSMSYPLSILFRTLIDTHSIPDEWRTAIVTPKFKKGSPSDPANYRPISLTCTCCKVLESIITSQILQFLSDHHLITRHQHGFLARHSTTTNLLECINDWTISIANHKSIIIAYVDFKAAFDCISHHKLLLKLSSYGIRDNLLLWIKSFLTNRSQVVRINSTYSSACSVTSGVIQGSVIGSLLFNLFVNDITDHFNPNTTVKLFADDIKLYTEYTNQTQNNLQHELEKIHVWSSVWQMQISHSKCNILQIGQSQTSQSIHINNIPIQKVNSVMDLGITIDTDLRFKLHINNIISKANQRSALIRRCFLSHNAQNLIRAFQTYVRPILEYASTTWSPSYITLINQIESVQRHFTKLIPQCRHLPYPDRLATLGIQSLEHRRLISDLTMCYNIIHHNNSLNQQTFFTINPNTYTRGHSLRIKIPLAKSNVRLHFFTHRIAPVWNALPDELVTAPSLNIFKRRLQKTNLSKFLNFPTFYKTWSHKFLRTVSVWSSAFKIVYQTDDINISSILNATCDCSHLI